MFMFVRIAVLIGLIKLLVETENPFLCSGIYAGVGFVLRLAGGNPLFPVLLATSISFGLASLYFWLLHRFSGSGALWWLILVLGILIGIV